MLQCGLSGMLAGMDPSGAPGSHQPALDQDGSHHHDGHEHGPTHEPGKDHADSHEHRAALADRIRHVLRPHSHEAADKIDATMEASAAGMRALWISLVVLVVTATIQAGVVALSGSVALLGDTLHNAADALTAVPLAVAFVASRRPATRRYTYGYGRAEDLAGIVIVVLMAASCAAAA
jgi:Co/Zn/Cd efflux system component